MVSNNTTPVKRSAAWRLFHKQYSIFTKNRFYNTINSQLNGFQRQTVVMHLSGMGQEEFEKMMGDYTIRINTTSVVIAELNKLEAPISFPNSDDALSIYNDIQEHIDDWIRALQNPFLRITPPPFEDFVLLDELAANIFKLGRDIVYNISNREKNKIQNRWFNISHKDFVFDKQHDSKQVVLYNLYRKNGVMDGY